MSGRGVMIGNTESGDEGTRHSSLGHDLRHSLFALKTGIDLLPHVHGDRDEFLRVQALLVKEIAVATDLAKRLLAAAEHDGPE